MKRTLLTLLLAAGPLLSLPGCGDKKDDPKAVAANEVPAELRLVNVGSTGALATVGLRETSARNPGSGKLLWSYDLESGTRSVTPLRKGQRVYLWIIYDYVNHPNYRRPTSGQYIQAELLLSGKPGGTVRLDANSFNDQSNYFQEDASKTHLLKEVEVLVQ